MKMENNITSDVSWVIASITVTEGDSVGAGDVIITITQKPIAIPIHQQIK